MYNMYIFNLPKYGHLGQIQRADTPNSRYYGFNI